MVASRLVLPLPPIESLGAVSSGTSVWRIEGTRHVTAVVKATFAFVPGGRMTPIAPIPLVVDDLAPFLPDADVSFVGCAYPLPGSRTTARLALFADEALTVPRLDKRVVVPASGDEHPAVPLSHDSDGIDTSRAFAPLAADSTARKILLGHRGSDWRTAPMPDIDDAFDWRYFRTVPQDQRCTLLQCDEWLLLEHLHPEHPLLKTQLPGAKAVLRAFLPGTVGGPLPLAAHADMLVVDGERRCCSIVWRGCFSTPEPMRLQDIRIWAGIELPGVLSAPWPAGVGQLPPSKAPEAAAKSEARIARAASSASQPAAPPPAQPSPAMATRMTSSGSAPQAAPVPPAMLAVSRAASGPHAAADPFSSTLSLSDRQQVLAAALPAVPFSERPEATGPGPGASPHSPALPKPQASKPRDVPLRDLESTVFLSEAAAGSPPATRAPGQESTVPISADDVAAALARAPLPFRTSPPDETAPPATPRSPSTPAPPASPWAERDGAGRNRKR